jgi:hypothetical protein
VRSSVVQSGAKEHNFLGMAGRRTCFIVTFATAIEKITGHIMEIRGRIVAVLPAQSGVSGRTGKPWKKQEYILETQERFPRKICFQIFGEERIDQSAIQEGEELTVHIDIDSQEYQGRWFTRINAWKVERGIAVAAPAEQQRASSASGVPTSAPIDSGFDSGADDGEDGLPF